MRSLKKFVVELEKRINDTITTDSGLELYVDNKYNEFKHRVTEGPIVSAPAKYNVDAKPGDTLFFHHLVVVNGGQQVEDEDDHYLVHYHPSVATESQAIAYRNSKGEVFPLGGWGLLEAVEEDSTPGKQSDLIELVKLKEDPVLKGRVAFTAPWIEEMGVKVGDVVGFPKNMDYRIKIDGKEYYRTRSQDFLYVEED